MSTITHKKIRDSEKNAHQSVEIDGRKVGEMWREQAHVTVSKFTAPRRTALKLRWFARVDGQSKVLGRGDRVSMILGAGFSTKDRAIDALVKAIAATPDAETPAVSE